MTCSAVTLMAASTMAASTNTPSPVRRRCSRASSRPARAWMPAFGSPTQYGSSGFWSGCPVSHVRPDGVLDGVGEGGVVAPGPVEAEAGHPDQDDVVADGPQRLEASARPGRAPAACSSRRSTSAVATGGAAPPCPRSVEKSRVRLFLSVLMPEKMGERSHHCVLGHGRPEHPGAVGPARWTRGGSPRRRAWPGGGCTTGPAQKAVMSRTRRPGEGRAACGGGPAPRPRVGAGRGARPVAGVLAEGRGPARAGGGGPGASGRAGAGWRNAVRGSVGERPPRLEVVEVGEVGAVGDRRVGQAEGGGELPDLVDGVVGEPLVDHRGEMASAPGTGDLSSIHSGWPTMHAEVEPLLAGAHTHGDHAVLGRAHPGGDDRPPAPERAAPGRRSRSPGSR